MSNYDGQKCIICQQTFNDGEDIVVCPDCGTPYHRECYLKEGRCINDELHQRNESWKPDDGINTGTSDNDSAEPIRCIRCGQENPSDGLFCKKCGMPLTGNRDEARPFNSPPPNNNGYSNNANYNNASNGAFGGFAGNPFGAVQQMRFDKDSDLDGVKLGDYAKFVGRNPFGMLSNFIRFAKFGGKASLNLGALFFPQIYFFYRKMNWLGALFMLISVITSIPQVIVLAQTDTAGYQALLNTSIDINTTFFNSLYNFASAVSMLSRCIAAVFANYFYYRYAKRSITKIHSKTDSTEAYDNELTAKGGTSFAGLIMAVLIECALTVLVIFLLKKFYA